ncbi:hypothetical protein HC349_25900 [Escherichia coli]|nr:hypothetical protein [Escherichia coli]
MVDFVISWSFVNGQIITRSSMFVGSSPGVGTRSPRWAACASVRSSNTLA